MKRTVFEIAYEGPAVDGIMDVRELAPALLALGNLVENAHVVIGDPESKVKVVVRSSFEKGSFQVTLELIFSISEQIRLFLEMQKSTNPAEQLLLLIGFASGAGESLIRLLKWLRGRSVTNATVLDNGKVRLEISGDNDQYDFIEADEKVIRLYRNRPVRESLRQVLSPLDKEGIEGFSVRKGKEAIQKITKDEVVFYEVPDEHEEEKSITIKRTAFVKLIEIAFEEGLKWRLSDGDNKFYATIADQGFINKMNAGKAFIKGDMLEVELETTQIATPKGIKNEHRVLRVINHLSQPQQIPLPFNLNDEV